MRVRNLELVEFRCFEHLKLDLNSDLIVLVGENGTGKTAILDALGALLGTWGTAVMTHLGSAGDVGSGFRGTDVRRTHAGGNPTDTVPAREAHVRSDLVLVKDDTWLGQIFLPSGATGGSEGLRSAYHESYELIEQLRESRTVRFPVHASYSTRRGDPSTARGPKVTTRGDGYRGSMGARTDLRALREWMSETTAIELQEGRETPERAAVESTVQRCIQGASAFRYNFRLRELQLTLDSQTLPLSLFSDGIRSMVSLVADLAWRCAVLNPHLGAAAALQTPGVVLIDEIDLHLHPMWQRRVLEDLRRAFPAVQFVVTTHSPQVISSADASCLRILTRDGHVERVAFSKGWDANSVLRGIMGADSRPAATRADLDRLSNFLDESDLASARDLLDQLRATLGNDDPDVLQAEWSLRLAEVEEEAGGP